MNTLDVVPPPTQTAKRAQFGQDGHAWSYNGEDSFVLALARFTKPSESVCKYKKVCAWKPQISSPIDTRALPRSEHEHQNPPHDQPTSAFDVIILSPHIEASSPIQLSRIIEGKWGSTLNSLGVVIFCDCVALSKHKVCADCANCKASLL